MAVLSTVWKETHAYSIAKWHTFNNLVILTKVAKSPK